MKTLELLSQNSMKNSRWLKGLCSPTQLNNNSSFSSSHSLVTTFNEGYRIPVISLLLEHEAPLETKDSLELISLK
jgi:hypothetical protein